MFQGKSSKHSKNLTSVKIKKKKFFSKFRNTVFYGFKSRFLVIFSVITGTVYCRKCHFPTVFFPKSENTVLKIFISRLPANTTAVLCVANVRQKKTLIEKKDMYKPSPLNLFIVKCRSFRRKL